MGMRKLQIKQKEELFLAETGKGLRLQGCKLLSKGVEKLEKLSLKICQT